MIIDVHTHCFPDELAEKAIPILSEKADIPAFVDGTIKQLKQSMTDSGVDISVLQPIATKPSQTTGVNRWAVSVQDSSIISFGTIHPEFSDWKNEIKWLVEAGVKGVKFHPEYQDFYVDQPEVFPIYEALFDAGLIVLFHAGVDLGYTEPFRCTPDRLSKVLDAFPGGIVIAAHMGGYMYWDKVEQYLLGRNIYLDTAYCFEALADGGMEKLINAHGVEKVLFATDSPWKDQTDYVAKCKALNLSREEIDAILGGNAKHLLGL
jgi:predicted TIM-barrel fold metal-dependent hydrolase